MRKKFSWLICLAIGVLAFAACDDKDNSGGGNGGGENGGGASGIKSISVQVEKGNDYSSVIDSVFVELRWEDEYDWDWVIIARSAYKNGNFTLNLPEKLDDAFLSAFDEDEDEDSMLKYVTISDKSVKTVGFSALEAYSNDRGYIGYIVRTNVDLEYLNSLGEDDVEAILSIFAKGIYDIAYVYAEKPVTLNGSYSEKGVEIFDGVYGNVSSSVNVSLKKGWNVVATKISMQVNALTGLVTAKSEMTSSEPSGLKWYFYKGGYTSDYAYGVQKSSETGILKSPSKSLSKFTPLFNKSKALKLFH